MKRRENHLGTFCSPRAPHLLLNGDEKMLSNFQTAATFLRSGTGTMERVGETRDTQAAFVDDRPSHPR